MPWKSGQDRHPLFHSFSALHCKHALAGATWQEVTNPSLSVGSQKSARKLLETTNKFRDVAGYRVNLCKSLAFLYTNKKYTEEEIVDTFPSTTDSKKIKYLEINLTKE